MLANRFKHYAVIPWQCMLCTKLHKLHCVRVARCHFIENAKKRIMAERSIAKSWKTKRKWWAFATSMWELKNTKPIIKHGSELNPPRVIQPLLVLQWLLPPRDCQWCLTSYMQPKVMWNDKSSHYITSCCKIMLKLETTVTLILGITQCNINL